MNGIEIILIIIVTVGGIIGISIIITKVLNHFFDLKKFENKISGVNNNKKLSEKALIISKMINDKTYLDLLKYDKSEFLDMLMELYYSFFSKINRKELNNTQKTLVYCMLLEDAVQADSIVNLFEEGIVYDELKDISEAYKTVGAKKTSDLINKLKELLRNNKGDIDSDNIAFLENEELYKKIMNIDSAICDYPDGAMSDIYYNYFCKEEELNELFENLEKEETETTNKIKYDYNYYIEIAKIISRNDQNVINEINECLANPNLYFSNHKSEYRKRFIMDSNNLDTIIWVGMVDCLIKNKYACERDYKDDIEDFIYFMNDMNYDVKFDKDILSEDGYVAQWCEELDKKLKTKNLCIGGIDIDSDSFVMFICDNNKLEKLSKYAQNIKHKITFASKL